MWLKKRRVPISVSDPPNRNPGGVNPAKRPMESGPKTQLLVPNCNSGGKKLIFIEKNWKKSIPEGSRNRFFGPPRIAILDPRNRFLTDSWIQDWDSGDYWDLWTPRIAIRGGLRTIKFQNREGFSKNLARYSKFIQNLEFWIKILHEIANIYEV